MKRPGAVSTTSTSVATKKLDSSSTPGSSSSSHSTKSNDQSPEARSADKYKHIFAIHAKTRTSTLSHDADSAPSFIGFRNLMVIVIFAVVGNLRLVIENYMKYGMLIGFDGSEFSREDVRIGLVLYFLIPVHLFVGYLIELVASHRAKRAQAQNKKDDNKDPKLRAAWALIAFAHTINATLSLGITTSVVYWQIHHPLIGSLCQFHAVIVWLKLLSYAFTNRDLRDAFLEGAPTPAIYSSCAYPKNITINNLCYFWWAPTLVYQPIYPRSPSFRWPFFLKRCGETVALAIGIWFLSAQYAVPVLKNSLTAIGSLNIPVILERLMKLSTVSLVIWLAGFFMLFQSFLNALAEMLRFGDREFYTDWWNSSSVGTYWKMWNKPVYHFMRRHVYAPLQARGWKSNHASMMVFTFSAILHEILVGVPTHNIIGVAFVGMMFQIPLIAITMPLERMRGPASVLGNVIFWISFCLVGQPIAVLLYYFSWQAKFGNAKLPGA
ncbi:MBOAT, membrane-bound O-acyltransferase family-domain-containing protein [Geopyxis carbonaria]|nr:MBOAT, membrane-bound O-acyltransferase family-domain-containing protein [Geopyxis carbonaria]